MDKQEVQTGLDWIRKLEDRAEEVARFLRPADKGTVYKVTFSGDTNELYADFTLDWNTDWSECLPMCYLWMDNEAILADVAERKRKKLEANRRREIEESERRIKQLRVAATDLAKEEARLAKLKEQA